MLLRHSFGICGGQGLSTRTRLHASETGNTTHRKPEPMTCNPHTCKSFRLSDFCGFCWRMLPAGGGRGRWGGGWRMKRARAGNSITEEQSLRMFGVGALDLGLLHYDDGLIFVPEGHRRDVGRALKGRGQRWRGRLRQYFASLHGRCHWFR